MNQRLMIQFNVFKHIDELKHFLKHKARDINVENLIRNVRDFVMTMCHEIERFMTNFYQLIKKLSINRSKLQNDR